MRRWVEASFAPTTIAQWATFAVAAVAAVLALRQLQAARDLSYENYALSAYQKYLELALNFPGLAYGRLPEEPTIEDYARYELLFGVLGTASDAILDAYPSDAAWRTTIEDRMALHCPLIVGMRPRVLCTYSPRFRTLVAQVRSDRCGAPLASVRCGPSQEQ